MEVVQQLDSQEPGDIGFGREDQAEPQAPTAKPRDNVGKFHAVGQSTDSSADKSGAVEDSASLGCLRTSKRHLN